MLFCFEMFTFRLFYPFLHGLWLKRQHSSLVCSIVLFLPSVLINILSEDTFAVKISQKQTPNSSKPKLVSKWSENFVIHLLTYAILKYFEMKRVCTRRYITSLHKNLTEPNDHILRSTISANCERKQNNFIFYLI